MPDKNITDFESDFKKKDLIQIACFECQNDTFKLLDSVSNDGYKDDVRFYCAKCGKEW